MIIRLLSDKNRDRKYSISKLCKYLYIDRTSIYYKPIEKKDISEKKKMIAKVFEDSYGNYGRVKIQEELFNTHFISISTRQIGYIMNDLNLISNYNLFRHKTGKYAFNEADIENLLNRKFGERKPNEVLVGDLTYIRIGNKWYYLYVLLDLCGRMIVGDSISIHKDAELVLDAFYSVKGNLTEIGMFHTDRGSEAKNQKIDNLLELHQIQRSLSTKGVPYDNAVIESLFNIIKIEFIKKQKFATIEEFKEKWFEFINWYNTKRLHSSLDFQSPVTWRSRYAS